VIILALEHTLETVSGSQDKPPSELKSPELYIKIPNWDSGEAPTKIEKAITQFQKATSDAFLHSRHLKHD
jgi:hypothetical protein